MKRILLALWNIFLFVILTVFHFLPLVIWYGKLPKVSMYHCFHHQPDTFNEMYEDIYAQTRLCPDPKEITVVQLKDKLFNDPRIRELTFPIIDHTGKKYGTMGLMGIIEEKLQELKTENKT